MDAPHLPDKPWNELSDIEKREAIALRLGWTRCECTAGCTKYNPPPGYNGPYEPDWPTNDGLAFTEVWPKVEYHSGCWLGRTEQGQCCVEEYAHEIISVSTLNTWADAICAAAYELLPVPSSGDAK